MPEHEELTTMEQIREAFTYYTRNPAELAGDLVGVLALCVIMVAMLTFGG
jgi:hypothetical protein|tara:strand:+ start:428 stop:577 length:150 start_codon:yes stop_codon:yes gene_type:complete